MLYEDYIVSDCGIRESGNQRVYFCDLLDSNKHQISFALIIQGCVGEKQYSAQYEAIAPHIRVGGLLHCELAWQWHDDHLNLCISGILPVQIMRIGEKDISVENDLNRRWAIGIGEWLRFPGLIHCENDAFVHTNFMNGYPRLSSFTKDSAKGELVWKPKSEPTKSETGRVRKTIAKFLPSLVRA
jgi:hypothetical protein